MKELALIIGLINLACGVGLALWATFVSDRDLRVEALLWALVNMSFYIAGRVGA